MKTFTFVEYQDIVLIFRRKRIIGYFNGDFHFIIKISSSVQKEAINEFQKNYNIDNFSKSNHNTSGYSYVHMKYFKGKVLAFKGKTKILAIFQYSKLFFIDNYESKDIDMIKQIIVLLQKFGHINEKEAKKLLRKYCQEV